MTLITIAEAAKILGVSKRTLYRWEKEGWLRVAREGLLNIRVYDRNYIETVKRLIDLNKREKLHLAKLSDIRKRSKRHMMEQDYTGKPLKLMDEKDVEEAIKVYEEEVEWDKENKRILAEWLSYPRDIAMEFLRIK
ncbi:MAG: MerR family transcriptional regulator [bacterium]|nr:MerR family transcriptional regulator [bacterium]